jgi:hypothetical protein
VTWFNQANLSAVEKASEYAIKYSDQKAHQAPDQAALRSHELSKLWWERLESLSPRAHQALAKELVAAGLTVEDYFKTLASLNAPAISTFLFELASRRDS